MRLDHTMKEVNTLLKTKSAVNFFKTGAFWIIHFLNIGLLFWVNADLLTCCWTYFVYYIQCMNLYKFLLTFFRYVLRFWSCSIVSFTAQKMNFPIKDFVSNCDQICSLLQIWYWRNPSWRTSFFVQCFRVCYYFYHFSVCVTIFYNMNHQGGLSKKEIKLNLCNMFSVFIFNELYLFA